MEQIEYQAEPANPKPAQAIELRILAGVKTVLAVFFTLLSVSLIWGVLFPKHYALEEGISHEWDALAVLIYPPLTVLL